MGIFFCTLWCSPAPAQTSLLAEIIRLEPAIVSIKSINRDIFQSKPQIVGWDPKTGRILIRRRLASPSFNRFGAGVIIDPSGIIVTNAHVVNRAENITVVLHDQTELSAQPLFVINDLDLGFIKIDLAAPSLSVEFGDSDNVKLRDQIITVSNSPLLRQTVSGGQVIGLGQSHQQIFKGTVRINNLIQTDINLYEGDSGGPVFDRHGQLIGIITAKEVSADRSSFAVPSNQIKQLLAEYLNGERPK